MPATAPVLAPCRFMMRYTLEPSADIQAYTSVMSTVASVRVPGPSRWSAARAAPPRAPSASATTPAANRFIRMAPPVPTTGAGYGLKIGTMLDTERIDWQTILDGELSESIDCFDDRA